MPPSFAIVGAGLAGLACAVELRARGLDVVLFDKGRGPGGRLSTRRTDGHAFDHGGQFITVRDAGTRRWMDGLVARGDAAPWPGRIVRFGPDGGMEESPGERFVGVPGMSALVRALAADLDDAVPGTVHWNLRVAALAPEGEGWRLAAEDGRTLGRFDGVVAAMPAPQAAALFRTVGSDAADGFAARAGAPDMAPCWAVMVAFDGRVPADWDGAFLADGGPLGWIARDSAKPGRPAGERWVLHASPAWSLSHLEAPADTVIEHLLAALAARIGGATPPVLYAAAHRWRYALPLGPALDGGFLWDGGLKLGACGDWCLAARAEAALLSGRALAARILDGGAP